MKVVGVTSRSRFEREDVLHPVVTKELKSRSLDITVELNDKDEMAGVGIRKRQRHVATHE